MKRRGRKRRRDSRALGPNNELEYLNLLSLSSLGEVCMGFLLPQSPNRRVGSSQLPTVLLLPSLGRKIRTTNPFPSICKWPNATLPSRGFWPAGERRCDTRYMFGMNNGRQKCPAAEARLVGTERRTRGEMRQKKTCFILVGSL